MVMSVTTERRNQIGFVRVIGEIDATGADAFLDAVIAAIQTSHAVDLDLRGVTFIDSAAARALRHAQRAAARRGCHLVVRRSRAVTRVVRLLDDLGLESVAG
jgi:anti-sigma B factor antagonist